MSNILYKEFSGSVIVWKYFLKAEDSQTAKCKLCKSIIKTTWRSTKGLHVHLKSKHKIDTKACDSRNFFASEEPARKTSALSMSKSSALPQKHAHPSSSTSSVKKHKITDHFHRENSTVELKVSRMVSKDGLPFSVFCTSADLRDLFNAGGYKLPTSPNLIKLMVMNCGTTMKMKVIQDLSKLKDKSHRFTLTFDEWTSTKNRHFLNVNIHAFDEGKPIFWNLGLARIFGSLCAESCVAILTEKLSEYDLSLDKDVVSVTTDDAKVMVGLINADQQLCYAHGIQLSVIDLIYKKQNSPEILEYGINVKNEIIDEYRVDNDLSDVESDGDEVEDNGLDLVLPTREVDVSLEYSKIIQKMRKVIRLFKKSPTKNDILQGYIIKDLGKNVTLLLDCKTRWSNLSEMITTFNKVKLCVSKALIDIGFAVNPDYFFNEDEYTMLMDLERIFQPVKLAVEVLCRRESNLITAETTLRFVISKLECQETSLAKKLATLLRKRIAERRTNMTATLLYLHDPGKYEEDRIAFMSDETFNLPTKTTVRKEIVNIVGRLEFHKRENRRDAESVVYMTPSTSTQGEDDVLFAAVVAIKETTELEPMSLRDELEQTLSSSKTACHTPHSRIQFLEALIKKEMDLFESGGLRGEYLQFAYNCLLTIVPTSVEADRAFSAAGHMTCKVRSHLADETISMLCFMRSYFQNNV